MTELPEGRSVLTRCDKLGLAGVFGIYVVGITLAIMGVARIPWSIPVDPADRPLCADPIRVRCDLGEPFVIPEQMTPPCKTLIICDTPETDPRWHDAGFDAMDVNP